MLVRIANREDPGLSRPFLHETFVRNFRAFTVSEESGLQIRVRIGQLFSLYLIQNICCGYSKKNISMRWFF